jgi:hypothetical protein
MNSQVVDLLEDIKTLLVEGKDAIGDIAKEMKKTYKEPYPFLSPNKKAKQPRKCNAPTHPSGVSKVIKKGGEYYGKSGLTAGTYGSPYKQRWCETCIERSNWLRTHKALKGTNYPLQKKVAAFMEKQKR